MTHAQAAADTTLTPALRRVLQILVRGDGPHTYLSVGQEIERTPKAVEKAVRTLMQAVAGTDIRITRRRPPGESAIQLSVSGNPTTLGRLLSEPPAAVQPATAVQHASTISLPSIGGVAYAYTLEGRLIVGGITQPVRVA